MSIEKTNQKKTELARRVFAPNVSKKEELAARVLSSINRNKKIELAARLQNLASSKTRTEPQECACNVHFSISPEAPAVLAQESSSAATYDWEALLAAGVDPMTLVSVEAQLYQMVNRGTLRASAALELLGLESL